MADTMRLTRSARQFLAQEVQRQLANGQSIVKVAATAPKAAPKQQAAKAPTSVTLKLKLIPRPNKTTETDLYEIVEGGFGKVYLPKGVSIANVRLTV